MMLQAAEAASGQDGERRPLGASFDPDLKIVDDFGWTSFRDGRGSS